MSQLGEVLGHIFDDQDAERVGAECFLKGFERNFACVLEVNGV